MHANKPTDAAEEQGLAVRPHPGSGAGRRPLHVLVVEDNETNQLVALGMLDMFGITAEVAANGVEAVEMAASTAYDAVLMDLHMPVMDGYAAARAIRSAEPPGVRVPIIAVTAAVVAGERERCLAAGMDDFLIKPVVTRRLNAVLLAHAGVGFGCP